MAFWVPIGSIFSVFRLHSREECQFSLHVYNNELISNLDFFLCLRIRCLRFTNCERCKCLEDADCRVLRNLCERGWLSWQPTHWGRLDWHRLLLREDHVTRRDTAITYYLYCNWFITMHCNVIFLEFLENCKQKKDLKQQDWKSGQKCAR